MNQQILSNKYNPGNIPLPSDDVIAEIMSDPIRMMEELYDEPERQRMGIGNYEKLYDPAAGMQTTAKEIRRIYGGRILERMRRELEENKNPKLDRPEGFVSIELVNAMKDTRRSKGLSVKKFKPKNEMDFLGGEASYVPVIDEVSSPKIQKYKEPAEMEERIKRQRQAGDDYFMILERGLFRNPEFRKIFKGPFSVYAWLWSNIARKGWEDKTGYPLKRDYYDRGYLAYSASLSQIGRDCFMNKDTVKSHIVDFYRKKIIKLEHLTPTGKKRGQHVYILGEWKSVDGKIEEQFYLNQMLLSGKVENL